MFDTVPYVFIFMYLTDAADDLNLLVNKQKFYDLLDLRLFARRS